MPVKHHSATNRLKKKAAAARKQRRINRMEQEKPVALNPAALLARPAILTWLDYRGLCEEWRQKRNAGHPLG